MLDPITDQVPAKPSQQFDLMANTGTTEHIANQAQAFDQHGNGESFLSVRKTSRPAGPSERNLAPV
jgi:hypothetical protein